MTPAGLRRGALRFIAAKCVAETTSLVGFLPAYIEANKLLAVMFPHKSKRLRGPFCLLPRHLFLAPRLDAWVDLISPNSGGAVDIAGAERGSYRRIRMALFEAANNEH